MVAVQSSQELQFLRFSSVACILRSYFHHRSHVLRLIEPTGMPLHTFLCPRLALNRGGSGSSQESRRIQAQHG